MTGAPRDHGGALDAAIAAFGGTRAGWLDLSTGINPVPYPWDDLPRDVWTALPDAAAARRLTAAARRFWRVPDAAEIVAAPGASALIARMPDIAPPGSVAVPGPTYNEHAATFRQAGRAVVDGNAPTRILVHPNNPDGRLHARHEIEGAHRDLTIIDESFCDTDPGQSHIALTDRPGVVVLKSFGKFWGLAGMRLGFAIGRPATLADLADRLGPWPVPGPALLIGARALEDDGWATATHDRLSRDAARLDTLMTARGADVAGGTTLFRLYEVPDAARWQDRLAARHVLTRVFPYSRTWLRIGLPGPEGFGRLEKALAGLNNSAGCSSGPATLSVGCARTGSA